MNENFWLESWAYWGTLAAVVVGFVFNGLQHRRERRQDEEQRIKERKENDARRLNCAQKQARWEESVSRRLNQLEDLQKGNRKKITEIYGKISKIDTGLARIEGSLNHKDKPK